MTTAFLFNYATRRPLYFQQHYKLIVFLLLWFFKATGLILLNNNVHKILQIVAMLLQQSSINSQFTVFSNINIWTAKTSKVILPC